MTLTSPGCPAGPQILSQVDSALKALEGVEDVDIKVVWSPPWSPDMLSEEARDQLGIF
jgi:metal-sulfur cluster biosynthetic enzyme